MNFYKIISIIFSFGLLTHLCWRSFVLLKPGILFISEILRKIKSSDSQQETDTKEDHKKWFEDYKRQELEIAKAVEEDHYRYDGVYLNLSTVQKDRELLFENLWRDWQFNKDNCQLIAPGDYHAQCLKMFGEMSFARKVIIAKRPLAWTQNKELFWRKICHPEIAKVDIREENLFDTRQRIVAENEFDSIENFDRKTS